MQLSNLLITYQIRLTTELLTPTSENSCKGRNKDAKPVRRKKQEEIPAKPGISKANKSSLKNNPSRVTNRNQKQLFTIRYRGTKLTTEIQDSPNKKVTA